MNLVQFVAAVVACSIFVVNRLLLHVIKKMLGCFVAESYLKWSELIVYICIYQVTLAERQ